MNDLDNIDEQSGKHTGNSCNTIIVLSVKNNLTEFRVFYIYPNSLKYSGQHTSSSFFRILLLAAMKMW